MFPPSSMRNPGPAVGSAGSSDDRPCAGCGKLRRSLRHRWRAGDPLRLSGRAAEETPASGGPYFCLMPFCRLASAFLWNLSRRPAFRLWCGACLGNHRRKLGCFKASGEAVFVDLESIFPHFRLFLSARPIFSQKITDNCKKIICIWRKMGYNKVEILSPSPASTRRQPP
jgi:hypothetical protein